MNETVHGIPPCPNEKKKATTNESTYHTHAKDEEKKASVQERHFAQSPALRVFDGVHFKPYTRAIVHR